MKKKVLGKGLSALMGEPSVDIDFREQQSATDQFDIDSLLPNQNQPRKYFPKVAIDELADSISKEGVLLPILVREHPSEKGFYEIIAGERRWRAAKQVGLKSVPVIFRSMDNKQAYTCAVIENVQRESLNPIEEAAAYKKLIELHDVSQDEISKMVYKSRSHIANTMRLLQLSETIQTLLVEGKLSMGHARALIHASSSEELANEIIAKGLSVRQTEALVKLRSTQAKPEKTRTSRSIAKDEDLLIIEKSIAQYLGLKVKIDEVVDGGRLSIFFSDLEQLDQLMQRLTTPNICDV